MSSSRILKSGQMRNQPVFSFSFEAVGEGVPTDRDAQEVDGFVPMLLGQMAEEGNSFGLDKPAGAPPPEPVIPAGMLVVAEDEIKRQLEESYHNGMEEGRRQADRGLANVFRALREGVSSLAGVRESSLRESEDDLLKLSIMVAGKIIQREIRQDRSILAKVVSSAVTGLTEQDSVVVRLNPDDFGDVTNNRSYFMSGIGDDSHITLKPDDTILSGGCLVETVTGVIDARIEAQLDEIYARLLEERGMHVNLQHHQLPEESDDSDAQG